MPEAPALPQGLQQPADPVARVAVEADVRRLSESRKRGCPTCAGVDAKSCMRCSGRWPMRAWIETPTGWAPEGT